ncbi:MAG: hypothetical protein HZA14_01730 [Nitrospirae bacterium]|nr:hypothetical protein [Nitrospirota bacterium]
MPTVKQHIKKSQYNESFFEDVKDNYQDWAITGLFYASLHLIEAFLALKGIHVENHVERSKYFSRIKELKPLYHEYKSLYEYSVNARYKMTPLSLDNINDSYKLFYEPLKNTIIKLTTPQ